MAMPAPPHRRGDSLFGMSAPDSDPADIQTKFETHDQPPIAPKVEEKFPCKCGKTTGRKLVVCIDGTSNRFGKKNSNVVEFYSHIDKSPDAKQLTYYNSGIGTYVEPSLTRLVPYVLQWLDNIIDLAFAWNFRTIVLAAYRWLSDNYQVGDQIYLFGFSRGAYQVRALAAMIETVGLIFAGNQEQIPFAYQLYADQRPGWLRESLDKLQGSVLASDTAAERKALAKTFKETFSHYRPDVKVHFVGVWDTVSSVGVFRGNLLQLTHTSDHICHFRHALALDERRVKFLPEYVKVRPEGSPSKIEAMAPASVTEKLVSEPAGPSDEIQSSIGVSGEPVDAHGSQRRSSLPPVKEVWFAGSHSDIGGGNQANPKLDRRTPSLLWIRYESILAGLRLLRLESAHSEGKDTARQPVATPHLSEVTHTFEPTNSLGLVWWLIEMLPLLNWKTHMDSRRYSLLPHLGEGRIILPHQKVHISVRDTLKDYRPKASFKEGEARGKWDQLLREREKEVPTWLEKMHPSLKDHLETSFYDEIMIAPLVSQLEHDGNRNPEVLRSLLLIANAQDTRAILAVENIIPTLSHLPPSKERDQLLSKLAKPSVNSLSQKSVTYEQAVSKAAADEKTRKQVLDIHVYMLEREYFACGAKGVSCLTRAGDIRGEILEVKGVASLVAGLRSEIKENIEACADALSHLAQFDDFRRAIMTENAIPTVVELFKSKNSAIIPCGVRALCTLAKQDKLRAAIRKANSISSLAVGLESDDRGYRLVCEEALRDLAENYDCRQAILDLGNITPTVGSLDSPDSAKVLGAARALRVLAKQDEFRAVILAARPMTSLIAGLSNGSAAARSACGSALYYLAKHDECRQAILDTNELLSVSELLKGPDLKNIYGGVRGLYFLADYVEFRALILRENPMPYIVTGISCDSELVRNACQTALVDLVKHVDCRRAIHDADIISSVVGLLQSGEVVKILGGAKALYALADHDDLRVIILKANVLPSLLAGLGCGSESAQSACRTALIKLVQHHDFRKTIRDASPILTVVELIKSGDSGKVLCGAKTLSDLVKQAEFHSAIFKSNPIPSLVAGLGCDDELAQVACGFALYRLARYDECRKEILKMRVIASITKLLKDEDAGKIFGGAKALYYLVDHAEFRAVMFEENAIPSLVAGLACDAKSVDKTCETVLVDLVKHDDGQRAILDASVIQKLIEMLEKKDIQQKMAGARGLYILARVDAIALEIRKTHAVSRLTDLTKDETEVSNHARLALERLVVKDIEEDKVSPFARNLRRWLFTLSFGLILL